LSAKSLPELSSFTVTMPNTGVPAFVQVGVTDPLPTPLPAKLKFWVVPGALRGQSPKLLAGHWWAGPVLASRESSVFLFLASSSGFTLPQSSWISGTHCTLYTFVGWITPMLWERYCHFILHRKRQIQLHLASKHCNCVCDMCVSLRLQALCSKPLKHADGPNQK
jgi:hypothetical protein